MPSIRQVRWARFRVAITAIAALAILSVIVYLLTGGTLFQPKATLVLYVPDATGLDPTTLVRVNGVDVGKISAIGLSGFNDPNRAIQVTLRLEVKYLDDIPVDSTAELSTENPLGQEYVDITRGTSSRHVRPGDEVALKPQPDLFKNIDIRQLDQRLRVIDGLMADIEQGKNGLGRLLLTDDLYNDLRAHIASLGQVVQTAASTTSMVGRLTYTDQLYRRVQAPLLQIDGELARIQAGQGPLGRSLREDRQYRALFQQFANLRQSITTIRSNPLVTSDDLYASWNRALGSLIQTVDAVSINPLLITSDVYDNWNGMLGQMRDTVRDFRQDPQKFLRIKIF